MTPFAAPDGEDSALNLPRLEHTGYTLHDWEGWEGRWELIDGVAYDMTPSPNLEHQTLSSRLHVAIANALSADGHEGCEVFAAPLDVYLGQDVVQPDLMILCDPARKSVRGIEGAPDLVVEILSPRTAAKDRSRKRGLYAAAGAAEYLIVDPEQRTCLLLRLQDRAYQEAGLLPWGDPLPLLGGTLPVTVR